VCVVRWLVLVCMCFSTKQNNTQIQLKRKEHPKEKPNQLLKDKQKVGRSHAYRQLFIIFFPLDLKLFTKEELATYNGKAKGRPIYLGISETASFFSSYPSHSLLAVLGDVFDVTKGDRYYAEGGGYAFFSGIDGTRAYVTG
jgi:hypothetical protein